MTKDEIIFDKLLKIATHEGLTVFYAQRSRIHDGWLKGNRIILGDGMKPDYTNFVFAHELAHYYLHRDKGDTVHCDKKLHDVYEDQANRLARKILIAVS